MCPFPATCLCLVFKNYIFESWSPTSLLWFVIAYLVWRLRYAPEEWGILNRLLDGVRGFLFAGESVVTVYPALTDCEPANFPWSRAAGIRSSLITSFSTEIRNKWRYDIYIYIYSRIPLWEAKEILNKQFFIFSRLLQQTYLNYTTMSVLCVATLERKRPLHHLLSSVCNYFANPLYALLV